MLVQKVVCGFFTENPIAELRSVTCHMRSQSVTCHPTRVKVRHIIIT